MEMQNATMRDTLLIVDDVPLNRQILSKLFASHYRILEAEGGREAVALAGENIQRLAAVLLDVVMPDMSGLEVLQKMREKGWMLTVPVFLVTTESTAEVVREGAVMGVTDIIAKPFSPDVVFSRVSNAIELFRYRHTLLEEHGAFPAAPLEERQITDYLWAAVGSCTYNGTAQRFRLFVRLLLSAVMQRYPVYRLSPDIIEQVAGVCVFYDIGKLAIPRELLEKRSSLLPAELRSVEQHPALGCDLLERLCPFLTGSRLQYAQDICLHHHERFNGKGYPEGLVRDDASIWAQTVGMADAYRALISDRPYRRAHTSDQAHDMLTQGQCGVFNPALVHCLRLIRPQLEEDSTENIALKGAF